LGVNLFEVMPTLQEDINDLDRMVDGGSPKDAIRSQVRLIAREVATLEADYASLAEAHAKLQEAHAKLKDSQMQRDDAAWDAIQKEAKEQQRIIQSHLLKH
jgi:hypothetical protein